MTNGSAITRLWVESVLHNRAPEEADEEEERVKSTYLGTA